MAGLNRALQPADLVQGRAKVELAKTIEKLNLESTPLLKLSQKVSKKGVGDMKFNWLTDELVSDWTTVTAVAGDWADGGVAGTITVAIADAWKFAEGDIISVPSVAHTPIYVTAVNYSTGVITGNVYNYSLGGGATSVDFTTFIAGLPDTGVNALFLIANTFELGSGRGTSKSWQPVPGYNYIQIVQHSYEVVETMLHITMDAGGPELSEQEEKALIAHEFAKEKLMFVGHKHQADVAYAGTIMPGVYRQYFTGGLIEAIQTNVTDAEGSLTKLEFGNWVNEAIYYAESPVIFASGLIFEGLSYWLGTTVQTQQSEDTLGIAVSTFKTQYGDLVPIVPHRELLKEAYAGYAFCVDLKDVGYRYLNGEDTHLEAGIQLPGEKKWINEYRTWFGFYLGNEKRHGMLKGVTGIS